ncbi:MAG: hypothetical protein ACR2RL_23560 [Gammaproteobacteria bacterium]
MVAGEVIRLQGASTALRDAFLRWQCRIRQIAARMKEGRPSDGMMPEVIVDGQAVPGHIVTVMSKRPEYAVTAELRHMAQRTHDPQVRRSSAVEFLGEYYYQSPNEFSDTLTATFVPGSAGARRIVSARSCTLRFEQFSQRYELGVIARDLAPGDHLREATFWHNHLFNPNLSADCAVLGFTPDWSRSTADPPPW